MRRLALLSALAVLELAACKHKASTSSGREKSALKSVVMVIPTVSTLRMSDPEAARQLISGFYSLESGSWRWTSSKFAIALLRPVGSELSGATIEFKFSLPDVVVKKVGPVTLSVKANGFALPSQTYARAGDCVYSAAVPAERLQGATTYLEFSADKAMPPSGGDRRELALIAISASISPK